MAADTDKPINPVILIKMKISMLCKIYVVLIQLSWYKDESFFAQIRYTFNPKNYIILTFG